MINIALLETLTSSLLESSITLTTEITLAIVALVILGLLKMLERLLVLVY
jgi:hypothetical protein